MCLLCCPRGLGHCNLGAPVRRERSFFHSSYAVIGTETPPVPQRDILVRSWDQIETVRPQNGLVVLPFSERFLIESDRCPGSKGVLTFTVTQLQESDRIHTIIQQLKWIALGLLGPFICDCFEFPVPFHNLNLSRKEICFMLKNKYIAQCAAGLLEIPSTRPDSRDAQ